jgi:hypothetical protein
MLEETREYQERLAEITQKTLANMTFPSGYMSEQETEAMRAQLEEARKQDWVCEYVPGEVYEAHEAARMCAYDFSLYNQWLYNVRDIESWLARKQATKGEVGPVPRVISRGTKEALEPPAQKEPREPKQPLVATRSVAEQVGGKYGYISAPKFLAKVLVGQEVEWPTGMYRLDRAYSAARELGIKISLKRVGSQYWLTRLS